MLRTNGVPEGRFDFSRGFTNLAVTAQAAIVGHGIALVPYSLVCDDIDRGVLRLMRGASISYPGGYYWVQAPRKAILPKVVRFRSWVEEEVAQMQRTLRERIGDVGVDGAQPGK
jgi:LysR family glycine cleavage system transcriptional activator